MNLSSVKPGIHGVLDPRMFASQPAVKNYIMANLRDLGVIPGLYGADAGYHAAADVVTQTADGRDLNHIWAELQQLVQVYNEPRTNLVNFLTRRVTSPIEEVPVLVTEDFEIASEYGVPRGIRQPGQYFNMGYDFKWYDLAARYTWMFLADATQAQVDSAANTVLEADNRLVMNLVLKTIFNSTNGSTSIRGNPYTVYKFYNNDGTVPPPYKNTTFLSTHNHYMATNNATLTPALFESMIANLTHHGYTEDRGYSLVLLANTQEVNIIRGFRAGTNGATYDFVPGTGQPGLFLPANQILVNGQPPPTIRGMQVTGKYGQVLIVTEDYMPAGYMFLFATQGSDSIGNPVGIRQHPNASLQGLRLVKGRDANYPLIDSYWARGLGTGIRYRGAGVVMQVVASATYTIPAAYA